MDIGTYKRISCEIEELERELNTCEPEEFTALLRAYVDLKVNLAIEVLKDEIQDRMVIKPVIRS